MDKAYVTEQLNKLQLSDPDFNKFGVEYHKYQLQPTISSEQLLKLESKYKISLPDEYRDFLLTIGNGGAGPGYGLLPFQDSRISLTLKDSESIEGFKPPQHDLLKLCEHGCGSASFLALTGKERGYIWYLDDLMFCYVPLLKEPRDYSHLYDLQHEEWEKETDKLMDTLRDVEPADKWTFTEWYRNWLSDVPF